MSDTGNDKPDEEQLHLSMGRIEEALDRLKRDGGLFVSSYEFLVKNFLAEILDKSVYKLSFADLWERCLSLGLVTREAPVEADEFFRWFCDHILWLSTLPGGELSSLYEQASRDLATIKSNLQKCEDGVSLIRKREPKTDHDGLDEKFFDYYRRKNVEAREEIINILAEGIRDEALYSARRRMYFALDFHVPWGFRWFPTLFDPDEFSEIRHKFGHMPLGLLDEVEEAYREQPPEFDRIVTKYFAAHDPPGELRALCAAHHRLAARNDVIIPALIAFQAGQYALFCSAAVLQVEGMFEDCCLELGVRPDSLQRQSIGPKLDALGRSEAATPNYPYYACRFPRLRNTLAHGRLLDPAVLRRTAELLLLDLVDVADHVVKAPSRNNLMITFLRGASPQLGVDIIKFATLAVETVDCPVDFYGLRAKHQEFLDAIENSEEAWELLQKLAATQDPSLVANAQALAKSLKKRDIAYSRCMSLLRSIGEHKEEAYERSIFWCQLEAVARARE